jgi:hypothetical protein
VISYEVGLDSEGAMRSCQHQGNMTVEGEGTQPGDVSMRMYMAQVMLTHSEQQGSTSSCQAGLHRTRLRPGCACNHPAGCAPAAGRGHWCTHLLLARESHFDCVESLEMRLKGCSSKTKLLILCDCEVICLRQLQPLQG